MYFGYEKWYLYIHIKYVKINYCIFMKTNDILFSYSTPKILSYKLKFVEDIFDTVTVRLLVCAVCSAAGPGVPTWQLQVRVQAWLLLPRHESGTPLL